MKFFSVASSILALATAVFAQDPTLNFDVLTKPSDGQKLTAGEKTIVQWTPTVKYNAEDVSLYLMYGKTPSTLQLASSPFAVAKSGAGQFTWTVDAKLGADEIYGIKLVLNSDPSIFQYSFPFHIAAVQAEEETSTAATEASTSETATASDASTEASTSGTSATSEAATSEASTTDAAATSAEATEECSAETTAGAVTTGSVPSYNNGTATTLTSTYSQPSHIVTLTTGEAGLQTDAPSDEPSGLPFSAASTSTISRTVLFVCGFFAVFML